MKAEQQRKLEIVLSNIKTEPELAIKQLIEFLEQPNQQPQSQSVDIPSDYGTEINLCKNNSFDISHREDGCRLLINISDEKIGWYGDDGNGNNSIKGNSKFNSNGLIDWVQKMVVKFQESIPSNK